MAQNSRPRLLDLQNATVKFRKQKNFISNVQSLSALAVIISGTSALATTAMTTPLLIGLAALGTFSYATTALERNKVVHKAAHRNDKSAKALLKSDEIIDRLNDQQLSLEEKLELITDLPPLTPRHLKEMKVKSYPVKLALLQQQATQALSAVLGHDLDQTPETLELDRGDLRLLSLPTTDLEAKNVSAKELSKLQKRLFEQASSTTRRQNWPEESQEHFVSIGEKAIQSFNTLKAATGLQISSYRKDIFKLRLSSHDRNDSATNSIEAQGKVRHWINRNMPKVQ